MSEPFSIRDAKEEDFAFIYSTWLKGLRFGNDVYGLIDQNIYFDKYHQIIEKILLFPSTMIIVACLSDDPNVILGYSVVGKPGTLHYIHVKQAWRRFGIATKLIPEDIKLVTHVTKMGWSVLKKKYPSAIFNPFFD